VASCVLYLQPSWLGAQKDADMNLDTDIFLSNMSKNTIFNLDSNIDTNTDNYSDLNIFEIWISE
jgi:hypothetical protein